MRIEWTIFYRILDIPDEITAPNYYQLLGVEPGVCTSELVMQSLNERKKRLRQNIPGPHFIPLVLKFEQENLDPSTSVSSYNLLLLVAGGVLELSKRTLIITLN